MQLTSMLSRWCGVREDLLFAFEKCLTTGLEDPLRQKVVELTARIRGGMPIDKALDLMLLGLSHEHFRDLIVAVRFNFRHRGNLPALLEQIELQLHRIESEYDKRRLSNARDRLLSMLILAVAPLLAASRLLHNPDVSQLFLADTGGRAMIILCLVCYAGAAAWFLAVNRRILD